MMKIAHLWRREFAAYFQTPLGFVLLAAFLLLSGYFFYSDLVFFVLWGGGARPTGLWRHVFLDMRLVLLVVVPLITMRSFAEERRLGTFELLCTFPVSDREIVAGKFLAAVSFLVVMLAPTLLYPATLAVFHPIEVGPLAAAYAGTLLLGIAFTSCGLAASSSTDRQVVAAVLTYGVLVLLWFLTWNEAVASEGVMRPLLLLSLFDRFYSFAGGLIETQDLAYFVLFTAFFLFLTTRTLQSRAWRGL
jgi:ABC-2 type transport system permease protein